jgi:DNA-binding transcriptional LysR family regulator
MSREELVSGLRRGELDLAILPSDGEDHEIESEPLSGDRALVALVSPEHPLASSDAPLGPDALKSELLLLLPRAVDPMVHDRLRMAMEESGYRFRAIHEVAGTNAQDLLLAVAQNVGVALTPDTYMELTESDIVVARPLDPQPALSPLVVAWPVNHRPWLEDVVRAARAVARDLRSSTDAAGPSTGGSPSRDSDEEERQV